MSNVEAFISVTFLMIAYIIVAALIRLIAETNMREHKAIVKFLAPFWIIFIPLSPIVGLIILALMCKDSWYDFKSEFLDLIGKNNE